MRRKERDCTSPAYAEEMFRVSEVITVAFNDGEFPYSVPLSFAEVNGALYVHCALEGHKLDCLKHDHHVHFSMYEYIGVDKELATVRYKCLMGTGLAELVDDMDEKQAALAALSSKYESKCTLPVPEKMLAATAVVRITILSMSGKKNDKPAA